MTNAERRRRDESHLAFLKKVTGLTFDPPFQAMCGIVFRARQNVRPNGRVEHLTLCSVVTEREELSQ